MERINAVGYYGWGNFGDELFRAAIEQNKDLIWGPDTKIRSFVTPLRFLHQNIGPLGTLTRFTSLMIGALWADKIALCGGSLLQDVGGNQRIRRALIKNRRPFEAIGVSLGPWSNEAARLRVQDYVSQMDRVVVRDSASLFRIGTEVTEGGDLAALYQMPTVPRNEREHLTICVSNDSNTSVEDLEQFFSALLEGVEIPVKLLALNVRPKRGDVEISHELARRLRPQHPNIEVLQFQTLDQTIDIIAKSRAVWSQRLHGLIVSYLCEVPILALSHHQKIIDFAEDIHLDNSYVRKDLLVSDSMITAAEKSLAPTEVSSWSLTASEYRQKTRDAFIHDGV